MALPVLAAGLDTVGGFWRKKLALLQTEGFGLQ
jgi:hypothetical protein